MTPSRMEVTRYNEAAREILDLAWSDRYTDALEIIRRVRKDVLYREGTLANWAACCLCQTGDSPGGLKELKDALSAGHWWLPRFLEQDDDLAPIHDDPAFRAIVDEAARRHATSSRVETDPIVVTPRPGPARGLFVALHGAFGRADESVPFWSSAKNSGMTVACAQSWQMHSDESFGWDDRPQTVDQIGRQLEKLRKEHPTAGPTILGGFSQGGRVAVELAIAEPEMAIDGFVVCCPSFPAGDDAIETLSPHVGAAAERGVRGHIVIGENDHWSASVEDLCRKLTAGGIEIELEVVPGLGHWIPDDFDARLDRGVDHIISPGEKNQE